MEWAERVLGYSLVWLPSKGQQKVVIVLYRCFGFLIPLLGKKWKRQIKNADVGVSGLFIFYMNVKKVEATNYVELLLVLVCISV